jgi:putative DNA-invertase from lambdoid prophage Rac
MAVYAYTRVSTTQQAEGESLAAQERKLRGWGMMNDHEIAGVFVEEGVSGSLPLRQRPQGELLFAKVQKGDTIVAVKLDRMFRSALDALQVVEELKTRGISLVLLDIGEVSNGLAKVFLTIAAAFGEVERDMIRDRVGAMKKDQKERGRYLGGKVPFGFKVVGSKKEAQLVAVPEEQVIIVAAKALRASQKPLRTIQATIEADHGRKLSLDTLSRLVG